MAVSYMEQSENSLQTVHHELLRLVLGAFRRSAAESLYSEAYEPLLNLRFAKSGF